MCKCCYFDGININTTYTNNKNHDLKKPYIFEYKLVLQKSSIDDKLL